jgi:hypothetical protein
MDFICFNLDNFLVYQWLNTYFKMVFILVLLFAITADSPRLDFGILFKANILFLG